MSRSRSDEEKSKSKEGLDVQPSVTPSRTSASEEAISAAEQRLVRKLDKRIMPIACLLYLFAYLDRSNLGNARLQGLPEDILHGDASGVLFDWVASAFYFSYILCQIPASITSKLFHPRVWIACAAMGWGINSTLMSTTFNFGSIMVTRIMLGVFEAGFGPVMPFYFSLFYTKSELGLRLAYWFGFAAVAGACGGLIAFGIQNAVLSIQNWRLLFIVEGIPPVLLGIVALIWLPNRPESTSFFNEAEREIALERMNRASKGDVGQVVKRTHILLAFRDWRVYTGGVIYFGVNCALASISAFLPTILNTLDFTRAKAQLMTIPPYAVAAVVLISFCYCSDRLQSRGLFMAAGSTIGAIGYLIMIVVPDNNRVRYFATFCITSGTYATIGLILAWFAHNLGSETKKATGIPIFMAIGQCGSVLGSHIYPKTEGPKYIKGFAIGCALEFLAAICAVILSVSYRRENTRRDRIYGRPVYGETVGTDENADQAHNFRYVP